MGVKNLARTDCNGGGPDPSLLVARDRLGDLELLEGFRSRVS